MVGFSLVNATISWLEGSWEEEFDPCQAPRVSGLEGPAYISLSYVEHQIDVEDGMFTTCFIHLITMMTSNEQL